MAGAGYKLFNTGDVLTAAQVNTYLQEQAVMRFANATARTTALSAVLSEGMISYLDDTNSVEVYNGSSWVNVGNSGDITGVTAGTGISGGGTSGDVTITNSMATAIDAKGDLVAGTADNAFARLAAGNNGESIYAASAESTGLRYNPPVASLANPVINGGFDIWQRGTANVTTSLAYTADRWQKSTVTAYGVSRQTTSDTTNLPTIQYAARVQRTAGSTSTTVQELAQTLENASSTQFIGKTVTLSFWARAGANYSSTSNALKLDLLSGTGTDQNVLSAFTGSATPITGTATLTTTWQRFAFSGTIASTATQLAVLFSNVPTGTAGANDFFEVTGVQLDLGTWTASTAPTFRRSGGTYVGELANCQRYYYRLFPNVTGFPFMGFGQAISSTVGQVQIKSPVSMRIAPSAIEITSTASNYALTNSAGTAVACSSLPTFFSASTEFVLANFTVASGLTAGNATQLLSNNTTATYVGISAEL